MSTRSVWRVPVGGGEEEQIVDAAFNRFWSAGERGVYFARNESQRPILAFLPFSDGRTGRREVADHRIAPVTKQSEGARIDRRDLLHPLLMREHRLEAEHCAIEAGRRHTVTHGLAVDDAGAGQMVQKVSLPLQQRSHGDPRWAVG